MIQRGLVGWGGRSPSLRCNISRKAAKKTQQSPRNGAHGGTAAPQPERTGVGRPGTPDRERFPTARHRAAPRTGPGPPAGPRRAEGLRQGRNTALNFSRPQEPQPLSERSRSVAEGARGSPSYGGMQLGRQRRGTGLHQPRVPSPPGSAVL